MHDILEVVARPEGVHIVSMDKDLVSLTEQNGARKTAPDPAVVANLPEGCRGHFGCLADFLLKEWDKNHFRPVETPAPNERVYFIGSEGGPVKIGLTTNVDRRLEHLQTSSPERLTLLATVPGGRTLERAYHECFGHLRIRGEWFRRDDIMEAEIRFWSARTRAIGHSAAHCGHILGHTGGN